MKIIRNNWYVIKLCWKAAPLWLMMRIVSSVLANTLDTIVSLFFMKYIIEAIQGNRAYSEALILIIGMFAVKVMVNLIDSYTTNVLEPKGIVRLTALLMEKTENRGK